jgi:CRISPR-associated exonuclease Cas4
MTQNHITGTQIAYLHLCHRKLWLFANGLNMEHTSGLVTQGRIIDEYTYGQRASKWQQVEIDGIKIDYYDPKNKVVREVKKSNKREGSHIAQVKYYIYILEQNGIEVSHAILEYPKLKKTEEIYLSDADREDIPIWQKKARDIISAEVCPDKINSTLCKRCSYYEFCYVDEVNTEEI